MEISGRAIAWVAYVGVALLLALIGLQVAVTRSAKEREAAVAI
jgi:hypothetical protein